MSSRALWVSALLLLTLVCPTRAEVFTFGPNAKHHWPTYLDIEGEWSVIGDQLTNGPPTHTTEFVRLLGRETRHGTYFIDRFTLYTERPEDQVFVTPSFGAAEFFGAGPVEIRAAQTVSFAAPIRDDGTYGRFGINYVHTVPEPATLAIAITVVLVAVVIQAFRHPPKFTSHVVDAA